MARLAILTLFMGQTRNRFLQYQQPRTILEILDMAGRTEGCEGVELRYPGDLADPKAVRAALERNNLGIAAINFASVRPDRWLRGAWSSTRPEERRAAVDDFKRCIDVAREIGAPRERRHGNDGAREVRARDASGFHCRSPFAAIIRTAAAVHHRSTARRPPGSRLRRMRLAL